MRVLAFALMLLAAIGPRPSLAAAGVMAEDFEAGFKPDRWSFSAGAEFPGAAGKFEKSHEAAHAGQGGGSLTFDFSGGGNYVAAILRLDKAPELAAVKLWVFNPGENLLTFRYCDQGGQTHQKPFTAAAGQWTDVTITMDEWQSSFGGARDGIVHGPPKWIAFLVENTAIKKGTVFLDDIRLVPGTAAAMDTLQYPAYQFAPSEGWSLRLNGNSGQSRLEGGKLIYDFTTGAKSITIGARDESLLGKPQQFRLRVRGQAPGHNLRLQLASHFMTFQRDLGEITGAGEHEIVVSAPPGEGWRYFGGENDGNLHGPLRVMDLTLDASTNADRGELELLEICVETAYPANRACLLSADYRPKDGKFTAVARGLLTKPAKGKLSWTIRDWDGATLAQDAKDVTIPALAEPLELAVDVPQPSRDFAEAEFTLEVEGQRIPPATACCVAPIHAAGDDKLDSASPFGMGLYLYRYSNTAQGLAEMDQAAAMASRAGVKWSREEFHWARIQPRKDQFDWAFYDRVVATAKKHGISVYGLLAYWSDWTKPYSQEGIKDYCRFAAAAAERYRDDIDHWEIWNEPNIFFWQGPRDLYAELLKQAYAAIKKANPKAQVLGCSTSEIDRAFIKRTLELGGPFDVLTIHPYRKDLHDLDFINDLKGAAELIGLPDGQSRPLWITEMGWSTQAEFPWMGQDSLPTSARRQAELLVRSYVDALASGVCPNISWYDFRNDGVDPFDAESNMGIVTRDFSPKPAYRAMATMTRLLAGRRFQGQDDVGKGVVAFQFTGADGTVLVLWNPMGELNARIPAAKSAQRVNLMGESRQLEIRDGKATISAAAAQPVFLLIDQ